MVRKDEWRERERERKRGEGEGRERETEREKKKQKKEKKKKLNSHCRTIILTRGFKNISLLHCSEANAERHVLHRNTFPPRYRLLIERGHKG